MIEFALHLAIGLAVTLTSAAIIRWLVERARFGATIGASSLGR